MANAIVNAARVVLSDAASVIVPGATSFAIRNHADSANQLLITDGAGQITTRSDLFVGGNFLTLGDGSGSLARLRTAADAQPFGIVRFSDGASYLGIVSGGNVTIGLGTLITVASATGGSGFRLPHGAAPTSPVNGDVWTTTAGMFVQINGTTKSVNLT